MNTRGMGIVELIELDEALLGAEYDARILAARFEVSVRTIERRKAHLRKAGYRLRTPPDDWRWQEKRKYWAFE